MKHSVVLFTSNLHTSLSQVDPDKYKSLGNGFKVSVKEGGVKALTLGWAPTLVGYSMQGIGKFGFYEAFKNLYGGILGEVCLFICYKILKAVHQN